MQAILLGIGLSLNQTEVVIGVYLVQNMHHLGLFLMELRGYSPNWEETPNRTQAEQIQATCGLTTIQRINMTVCYLLFLDFLAMGHVVSNASNEMLMKEQLEQFTLHYPTSALQEAISAKKTALLNTPFPDGQRYTAPGNANVEELSKLAFLTVFVFDRCAQYHEDNLPTTQLLLGVRERIYSEVAEDEG